MSGAVTLFADRDTVWTKRADPRAGGLHRDSKSWKRIAANGFAALAKAKVGRIGTILKGSVYVQEPAPRASELDSDDSAVDRETPWPEPVAALIQPAAPINPSGHADCSRDGVDGRRLE